VGGAKIMRLSSNVPSSLSSYFSYYNNQGLTQILSSFGWKARIGLEQGIVETYKWYVENVCKATVPFLAVEKIH